MSLPTQESPSTLVSSPLRPVAVSSARWGVVALVLALIPLQAFWLVRVETKLGSFGTNNTDVSLFFTTVFALFVAGLFNHALARRRPHSALPPPELAAPYLRLTHPPALARPDL